MDFSREPATFYLLNEEVFWRSRLVPFTDPSTYLTRLKGQRKVMRGMAARNQLKTLKSCAL